MGNYWSLTTLFTYWRIITLIKIIFIIKFYFLIRIIKGNENEQLIGKISRDQSPTWPIGHVGDWSRRKSLIIKWNLACPYKTRSVLKKPVRLSNHRNEIQTSQSFFFPKIQPKSQINPKLCYLNISRENQFKF